MPKLCAGNVAFKPAELVGVGMKCHYCDDDAAFAADTGGVRVGLCEMHFRERLEELADADELEALKEQVDVDRA
jgi:hypothetical protein